GGDFHAERAEGRGVRRGVAERVLQAGLELYRVVAVVGRVPRSAGGVDGVGDGDALRVPAGGVLREASDWDVCRVFRRGRADGGPDGVGVDVGRIVERDGEALRRPAGGGDGR